MAAVIGACRHIVLTRTTRLEIKTLTPSAIGIIQGLWLPVSTKLKPMRQPTSTLTRRLRKKRRASFVCGSEEAIIEAIAQIGLLSPIVRRVNQTRRHEVRVARRVRFTPGTTLVFDRGYADYEWFRRRAGQQVYFVTRLKDKADYGVVEERELPRRKGVLRDQVIFLYKLGREGKECFFRRVEFWDEEQDRLLVFLTNQMTLSAATIAAIYKERWSIELFFENSTWCTPSYVMEFQEPFALNRPLLGSLYGSVRPYIAPHLLGA